MSLRLKSPTTQFYGVHCLKFTEEKNLHDSRSYGAVAH